jgi:hypothetical protein
MTAPALSHEVAALKEIVCKHDAFIDGNGTKGAKERIGLLEQSVLRIESSVNRISNYMIMLIVTIGGSVAVWFITTEMPKIIADLEKK